MKGRPVDELVFGQMFPRPRHQDPQNFHALLQRHLILEVRQEVQSFYGHIDTSEAKYPGLDYSNKIHRTRLSRWPWHRRLFRAFDALRLTSSEISGLTMWEGTKWAKERYEREQNCTIRDTAADGMPVWTGASGEEEGKEDGVLQEEQDSQLTEDEAMDDMEGETEEDLDIEDSEGELQSVGDDLNARLRARVAARNAGDLSIPMDEDWEQWLKDAAETGGITAAREQQRMIDNARAGNWHAIPAALRNTIREALQAERGRTPIPTTNAAIATTPSSPSVPSNEVPAVLSAPTPLFPIARPHNLARSSYSGLRRPDNFQGVDGGGTSLQERRNNNA